METRSNASNPTVIFVQPMAQPITSNPKSNVKPSSHINWTDDMIKLLISSTLARKGYKRTDMSIVEKFDLVAMDLMKRHEFAGHVLNGDNMKKKFVRIKEEFEKKYGLSEEGANLSGLGEMTENEELLYNICKELEKIRCEKEEKEAKLSHKKQKWDNLEQVGLKSQASLLDMSNDDVDTSSGNNTPSTPSSLKRKHTSTKSPGSFNTFLSEESFITAITDDGMHEHRQKEAAFELQRKKELHALDMQFKEAELAREERKLKLEEEKVRIDAERMVQSRMQSEQMQMMFKIMCNQLQGSSTKLNNTDSK